MDNYSGSGNGYWYNGWGWNPNNQASSAQSQQQQPSNNVQVVQLNWNDLLSAQQSAATSGTSNFRFPMASHAAAPSVQNPSYAPMPQGTGGGTYTTTGIREEVEGQNPATMRISVGGDLSQMMNLNKNNDSSFAGEHGGSCWMNPQNPSEPFITSVSVQGQPSIPGQEAFAPQGDHKIETDPVQNNIGQTNILPKYKFCGNCDACKNQPKTQPNSHSFAYLCRGKKFPSVASAQSKKPFK